MKEAIVKMNKSKSWFFEEINKIDKSLARLTREKREKNQVNKTRNEKGKFIKKNYSHEINPCRIFHIMKGKFSLKLVTISNHVYQFIDVYKSTFVKIFMCVDSEKTSVVICQLQY